MGYCVVLADLGITQKTLDFLGKCAIVSASKEIE